MRQPIFALPLLAATTLLAQQQRFPVPSVKSHSFTDPADTGPAKSIAVCPVSLFARQQGAPQTYWTITQEDKHDATLRTGNTPPAGYGVHVDLSQLTSDTQSAERIRTLTVQVFYIAAGTRALLLDGSNLPMQSPANQMTRSKTFRLEANAEALIHLEANLLVGPASGITRVHLLQVDYADGRIWTAPNAIACSTTPSLYVPVTN